MGEQLEFGALCPAETVRSLAACNARTARFGLTLTAAETAALAEGRVRALRDTGRVEFGGGILPRLVLAFCDSPYLEQTTYADTLLTLQETFYAFKNEFKDRMSDESLLKLLRRAFDDRAHGAAELLAGLTPLELLGRKEPTDDQEE